MTKAAPFPLSSVPMEGQPRQRRLATLRRVVDHDVAGLRGMSLRRLAWTLLAVLLLAAWSTLGNAVASDHGFPTAATLARLYPVYVLQFGAWMPAVAFAGTLADNLPLSGGARVLAFGAAFMLGSTAGQLIQFFRGHACLLSCPGNPAGDVLADAMVSATYEASLASAIAVAYFAWRRDRDVAAALQAAELARADAERERLQTTLAAMQARVEPSFLLDVLRDVGRSYAVERAVGGRLLDLLIAYLRAALPKDRAGDSTLERESALLRSWLGIVEIRSGGRLAGDCRLDPALRGVRLAPMLLLPLVMAAGADEANAAGAIDVAMHALDGRVRIAVRAVGPVARAMTGAPAIAETAQRLRSIYGARAAFVIDDRGDNTLQLIVEVPDERA